MLATTLETLRRIFGVAGRQVEDSRSFSVSRSIGADLIYRLRAWPQLPESGRTAEIYRMLSIMSNRPVNRQWILSRTRMEPHKLEALLRHLVSEGALEVIDPSRFAPSTI